MRSRAYLLILGFLLVSCTGFTQKSYTDPRSGIVISFVADDQMFPDAWKTKEINPKAVSLDSSEYARSRAVIERALKKYPQAVLTKNLKKIYVMKYIGFFGEQFGGTNSTDAVYIGNDGVAMGYTDFYLEQTFHSEFSSIILRNYSAYFNKTKWMALNSKGFSYGRGGVNALKTGKTDEEFLDDYNKNGVLNQYGASDMENDFNEFAQNLFLPKAGFSEVIEKYPAIRAKRLMAIELYRIADSSFTEGFFDKLMN
jgi:hypothetical protein